MVKTNLQLGGGCKGLQLTTIPAALINFSSCVFITQNIKYHVCKCTYYFSFIIVFFFLEMLFILQQGYEHNSNCGSSATFCENCANAKCQTVRLQVLAFSYYNHANVCFGAYVAGNKRTFKWKYISCATFLATHI